MAMGMTYAEFWDGPCDMVKAFRKYDEIRQERENQAAWLQGLYIYEAVASCLDSKGKVKYPQKPYPLNTKISKDRKREEEREQMLLEKEKFLKFARNFNKRFAEREANKNA